MYNYYPEESSNEIYSENWTKMYSENSREMSIEIHTETSTQALTEHKAFICFRRYQKKHIH